MMDAVRLAAAAGAGVSGWYRFCAGAKIRSAGECCPQCHMRLRYVCWRLADRDRLLLFCCGGGNSRVKIVTGNAKC